jgi:hypothetical protein
MGAVRLDQTNTAAGVAESDQILAQDFNSDRRAVRCWKFL